MKTILHGIICLLALCSAIFGQSIKSLGYNTTNGVVIADTGTNVLTFTNNGIRFSSVTVSEASFTTNGVYSVGISTYQGGERYFRLTVDNQQPVHFRTNETLFQKPINFNSTNGAAATSRANIGFSTNLNNLWTATNVNDARATMGLNVDDSVVFNEISGNYLWIARSAEEIQGPVIGRTDSSANQTGYDTLAIFNSEGELVMDFGEDLVVAFTPIYFQPAAAATTRAQLGFSTNLNTLWTATSASNARSAVGLGWSALTNTNAATSLLGFTTNGQVVANTGTNMLRFTNTNAVLFSGIISTLGQISASSGASLGGPIVFAGDPADTLIPTLANMGLGGGITATKTFVSYNGTNYTTNTVTISNGIITGWTQ